MFRNTSILLTMLISISSIVSFAQTGDSLKCYNKEELQKIALRMVRANECDTLLNIAYRDLEYCDSIIAAKDSVIVSGIKIIEQQTKIAQGFKEDRDRLLKEKKKDDRKIKWLKIGWVSTSAVLTAAILYLLLP